MNVLVIFGAVSLLTYSGAMTALRLLMPGRR
jgi:hypothetical protein